MMIRPEIKEGKWGKLGIFRSPILGASKHYILLIPGFTGDALLHTNFIEEALRWGFGVLGVTPNWGDSVQGNINKLREAMEYLDKTVPPELIKVIRANSFGAYLGTQVLDMLPCLEAAIFITPCSAKQLNEASAIISKNIILDFSGPPKGKIDKGLIYLLKSDQIVPIFDLYFKSIFSQLDIRKCGGDHFTAPDQNECCGGAMKWVRDITSKQKE